MNAINRMDNSHRHMEPDRDDSSPLLADRSEAVSNINPGTANQAAREDATTVINQIEAAPAVEQDRPNQLPPQDYGWIPAGLRDLSPSEESREYARIALGNQPNQQQRNQNI